MEKLELKEQSNNSNLIIDQKDTSASFEDLFQQNLLKEEEAGILEFFNTNKGFKCILKHRYSDFLVNEIDIDGNVVWAERVKFPEEVSHNPQENLPKEPKIKKEPKKLSTMTIEDIENALTNNFTNLIKQEEIDKLKSFCFGAIEGQKTTRDFVLVQLLVNDKNVRKEVHEALRNNFDFLDSSTEKDSIKIFIKSNSKENTQRYSKKDTDYSNICNKKYTYANLLKRNTDLNYAVNFISRYIHRSAKTISFAGNKDKRGITTQRISFFNVNSTELEKAQNSKGWDRKIELSNFSYSDTEFRLGYLSGNQFSVVLRFIEGIDDLELTKSVENLKKGFVNYFGMQRFGVGNNPTHLIGKALIQKNWKKAVAMIIKSNYLKEAIIQTGLQNDIKSIDEMIENKFQVRSVMGKLNRRANTENKILQSLHKTPGNYNNAFKTLNRNLKLIYPHAYQSFIWNLSVSHRLKKFGSVLIIGDIVLKDKKKFKDLNIDLGEDSQQDDDEKEENEMNNNTTINTESDFYDTFEIVDEKNITNFTIYDLYIPLVGKDVVLPKNEIGDYMMQILKEDGIDINDASTMLGKGNYRKVIQVPNNVSFEKISHDDPDEELQNEYYNKESHPVVKGSKYTSMRLCFQVPQSTYATMVFRELTKQSSSFEYQSQLTKTQNENN